MELQVLHRDMGCEAKAGSGAEAHAPRHRWLFWEATGRKAQRGLGQYLGTLVDDEMVQPYEGTAR